MFDAQQYYNPREQAQPLPYSHPLVPSSGPPLSPEAYNDREISFFIDRICKKTSLLLDLNSRLSAKLESSLGKGAVGGAGGRECDQIKEEMRILNERLTALERGQIELARQSGSKPGPGPEPHLRDELDRFFE